MGWGTSEKDLVRLGGLAAVHQVEHLLVPLGALMRERGHRRVDALHHVVHRSVARRWPPLRPGHLGRLPVHGGDRGRRAAQRQALDQQLQVGRHPPGSPVRARPAGQRGQPSSRWARSTCQWASACSRCASARPGSPACALSAPAATWAVFLFRDGAVRMVTVPQPWKWNTLAVMPPALESLHPPFRKLSHNASSTTCYIVNFWYNSGYGCRT